MDATKQIKFLTYNVWSREDIFVYKRMQAIGALVKKHDPDVIFFQEVTPYIRSIFEDLEWWSTYHCSPAPPEEQPFCLLLSKLPLEKLTRWKFANSPTGRCYVEAEINPPVAPATMKPIRVATTQLERASLPAPMRCVERYAQAEHAVAALSSAENVVFGGDMCWRDGTDRPFPLPPGWFDAWPAWKAGTPYPYDGKEESWWTYDVMWEEEVVLFNGFAAPYKSTMLKRSDRFVCKLKDFSLEDMQIIGDNDTGIRHYSNLKLDQTNHDLRSREGRLLRPSCHRGLLRPSPPRNLCRMHREHHWGMQCMPWGDLDSIGVSDAQAARPKGSIRVERWSHRYLRVTCDSGYKYKLAFAKVLLSPK